MDLTKYFPACHFDIQLSLAYILFVPRYLVLAWFVLGVWFPPSFRPLCSILAVLEVFVMPSPIPGPQSDVFPRSDADLATWAQQFDAEYIASGPLVGGPAVVAVTNAVTAYVTALATASAALTRTPVTIAQKNAARATMITIIRSVHNLLIAGWKTGQYTDGQLTSFGFRIPDLTRTPSFAPVYAPLLGYDGSEVGVTRFRVQQVDQTTGNAVSTRGFSSQFNGVEIRYRVGMSGAWQSAGVRRRVILPIDTSAAASGSLVECQVRYINRRGLVSPWSLSAMGVAIN